MILGPTERIRYCKYKQISTLDYLLLIRRNENMLCYVFVFCKSKQRGRLECGEIEGDENGQDGAHQVFRKLTNFGLISLC